MQVLASGAMGSTVGKIERGVAGYDEIYEDVVRREEKWRGTGNCGEDVKEGLV